MVTTTNVRTLLLPLRLLRTLLLLFLQVWALLFKFHLDCGIVTRKVRKKQRCWGTNSDNRTSYVLRPQPSRGIFHDGTEKGTLVLGVLFGELFSGVQCIRSEDEGSVNGEHASLCNNVFTSLCVQFPRPLSLFTLAPQCNLYQVGFEDIVAAAFLSLSRTLNVVITHTK